ncbi:hypothetical protein BvRS1_29590 [Burkholderia vietnamiensis]|nr:hypothetical protein BvRS1_29590 [Burkholderia vietnamiensis]
MGKGLLSVAGGGRCAGLESGASLRSGNGAGKRAAARAAMARRELVCGRTGKRAGRAAVGHRAGRRAGDRHAHRAT